MDAFESALKAHENIGIPVLKDVPLSRYASFRTGGNASLLISPSHRDQLIASLAILDENGIDHMIIGRGSNLLISDEGYKGAVIRLAENYSGITVDNDHLVALSGTKLSSLCLAAHEHSLSGAEFAEIMIATEAAAEGLNLQFCSLVVNYDLPWNPQRIEQRIGRCHRYGQKYDVVVVNFANQRNYADVRVFSLLSEKFHLFNDVFGASDDVLGQADAIDFEKRIWEIYQECRTEAEINAAFEALQRDLQEQINEKMQEVREQVLENFDIGVQERLKLAKSETGAFLNRYEHIFWELTRYVLADSAVFDDETHSFTLRHPVAGCKTGKYQLLSCVTDGIPYRLSHPLGQYVLHTGLSVPTEDGAILFREKDLALNVALPDALRRKSGYLVLARLAVSAFDDEQYCLFTAFTKEGKFLTQEECERLFLCGGEELRFEGISEEVRRKLGVNVTQHSKSKLQEIDSRNLEYFHAEEERIFRWEKDLIESIERELDVVKRAIREQERLSRSAVNMEEKLAITKKISELERQKRKKRNELADREDEVSDQRRRMIDELDRRMVQRAATEEIFVVEWRLE